MRKGLKASSVMLVLITVATISLQPWSPSSIEAAPIVAVTNEVYVPDPPTKRTHLYELQLLIVRLEEFSDGGGAIEPLGDKVLVVTPRGRIALVGADGEISYLPQMVPMFASPPDEPITWVGFRVADILLKETTPEAFSLFVSHHYLVGDCVEFRVSSTVMDVGSGEISMSGDWKTEFTANPCIDQTLFERWEGDVPKTGGGIQAGGRLLMDGPEHLLVAVGDHAWYEWHERQEERPSCWSSRLLRDQQESHVHDHEFRVARQGPVVYALFCQCRHQRRHGTALRAFWHWENHLVG